MRVEHMKRELKEKKAAAKSIGNEYTELNAKAKSLSQVVNQLFKELSRYQYDESTHMELIQQKRTQEAIILTLREVLKLC